MSKARCARCGRAWIPGQLYCAKCRKAGWQKRQETAKRLERLEAEVLNQDARMAKLRLQEIVKELEGQ